MARFQLSATDVANCCGVPRGFIEQAMCGEIDLPAQVSVFLRLFYSAGDTARREALEIAKVGTAEWRAVPDFPEYEVSALGDIRRDGRALTPTRGKSGHLKVTLYNGQMHRGVSRGFRTLVHRVVASAFLTAPEPGLSLVCHRNGIPSDNRAANLMWGTTQDNVRDRQFHAMHGRGKTVDFDRFSN